MTTSSVKPTVRILLGLMLILSPLCVSAAGRGKAKKHHREEKRAAARVTTVSVDVPTTLDEYFCEPTQRVVLRFDYTGSRPNNGFVGNQYATIIRPNGRRGPTTKTAVQWSTFQVPQTEPGGTTWSYQAQDGSFVCDPRRGGSVFVPTGQGEVRFINCRNLTNRVCRLE